MQSTHPAPTSAAIEIVALTKRYAQGKPAVDAINLRYSLLSNRVGLNLALGTLKQQRSKNGN